MVSDSPRSAGSPVVLALFAVAVCALLACSALTVAVIAHAGPERCCVSAAAASPPSPTTRTGSTREAGLPMCLIGSWRTVDEHFMIKFYTDEPEIPFTGSGRIYEFHADGTGVERGDNVVLTASFQGHELRMVGNGTINFTWTANDRSVIYVARTGATYTWTSFDQRGQIGSAPVPPTEPINEVDAYTCQGAQYTETNDSRGYHSVWARTAGFGMYG
jgi:hypothetical protein